MPAIKKCYYEVLGVERTAGDDEIKKNFRRLALQLHPDKNPDRLEEAKEEFQTLQQAYEVLSNSQERAWYDEHRLSVLKGEDTELDEDIIDLFPFMTSGCYKGFGDDDEGFYTIYRKVFESITALETEAGLEDSDEEIPSFGDSLSGYEDVVGPFYAYWESYCTRQSFGWMDEYDTRQAEHRRIARLMDKENEKVRRAHRQAWNQKVRALVDFVKRKDKRAIAWKAEQERILKEKEEAMKKKQAELKASRAKERQKLYEQVKNSKVKHVEENKDKLEELESFLADEFQDKDYVDDSESEEDMEYCHVCSKSFRTKKALVNHEKSKKHLQMLEKFAAENNIATSESDEDAADIEDAADSTDEVQEQVSQENNQDSPQALPAIKPSDNEEQALDSTEDADADQLVSNFKQSLNLNLSQSKKPGKKMKKKPAARKATFSESSDAGLPASSTLPSNGAPLLSVTKDDSDSDFSPKKPTKEKKRRRANKAATTPAATSNDAPSNDEPAVASSIPQTSTDLPENEVKLPYVCGRCKAGFDSRSKLFKHIEKTGHALPPDAVPTSGEKPVKGKKGKRR